MNKQKFIILFVIFSCLLAWGKNATTMEYRSAKTAARSERDLDRAETLALKALDMKEHANDGRVAYFLAIEIYKPRKNWEEMNKMLDIAISRNPEQSLERPFKLDNGTVIKTIADAVPIYKEQIWINFFNQTVELINVERFDEALEKINLAKLVLEKVDNYLTSSLLYLDLSQNNKILSESEKQNLILLFQEAKAGNDMARYDLIKNYSLDINAFTLESFEIALNDFNNYKKQEYMMAAKTDIEKALELEPNNERVLQIAAEFAQRDNNFEKALEYYNKALDTVIDKTDIITQLIYINVELEEYDTAIELSDDLLTINLDNPDVYFNMGVIYQRLASDFYEKGSNQFNEIAETPTSSNLQSGYDNFNRALEFAQFSMDYFMDASLIEETENLETEVAIAEMKRLRKNIKTLYIKSIKQIARDNDIELN